MAKMKALLAICLSLGAVAAPATAQVDGLIQLDYTPQGDDIVVTRKTDPEPKVDEVRSQARAITAAVNIFDEPLAMYQRKMCPGVSGLPEELALFVADRIRYNIERIGLELADPEKCSPNLLVSFVLDGRSVLQGLKGKPTSLFAYIPKSERDAILRDTGPVHSWNIVSLRTRDGVMQEYDIDQQYAVLHTQSSNSLILLNARKDIEFSIVIIDIPAIDGMSGKQLADYATMRGLAKTKPVTGDAEYGTILNLFDPDSLHPAELTTFDIAYLKNLYANMPNIPAASKLGTVKGEMRKQLAAAQVKSDE